MEVVRLSDEPLEMPRIAYDRHNGSAYRYVYSVGARDRRGDDFVTRLVRLDVVTGTTRIWSEPGRYPGEPVCVPLPDRARNEGSESNEDAGVVLSLGLDSTNQSSFLLVLDAATFGELARAEVPHPVPFDFHGLFLRDA